jgi:beta-lactamase regulating signal transducer with metallopeptidase domain/DUF4097 and DUF4098 domain-containing protein YvlB
MIHSFLSLLSLSPLPQVLGILAKVTLVLIAGALVATVLRRRSAAVRHLVWALTLLGALTLPLLSSVAPELVLSVAQPQAWSTLAPPTGSSTARAPQFTAGVSSTVVSEDHSALDTRKNSLPTRAPALSPSGWLALVWLGGSVAVLLWAALGHLGLVRLARRAVAIDGPAWRRLLGEALVRIDPPRSVRLCTSPGVGAPVTWGWRRPVVVLPVGSETWPEDRRRVALEHELAHIARRDYLAQLGATLACAVYWFHPLVWAAARRMRTESEHACDDRVLTNGTPGADYATHLLDVARGARVLCLGGSVAVCMARPSQLEGRLLALLDDARPRGLVSTHTRVVAAAMLALALVPLAGLRPELRAAPPEPANAGGGTQMDVASEQPAVAMGDDKDGHEWSADSTFEKGFKASPGELLTLDLDTGGDVELESWNEPEVRVRVRLGGPDWRDTGVDIEREAGGVRVTSRQDRHRRGGYSTSHSFEIRAPRQYDLRLRSAGGSVKIVAMEGNFRGQTGGGEITLQDVHGQVSLSTGGGEILVSDVVASGSVRTGGGMVRMSRVQGGLRATSGSGPVIYSETSVGKGQPAGYGDLKGVEVDASGEHIADERTDAAGVLTIERAGGEVTLGEAPNGARINTGGGDIRVGRSAGMVEAKTGGGDIDIGPVAGSVVAGTGAGEVRVTLVSARGEEQTVEVSSGNGRIVLELPEDLDASFDLETAYTNGYGRATRIDSAWKLQSEETKEWDDSHGTPRRYVRARGVTGKGRGMIYVRTVNGDIVVRRGGK